MGRVIRWAWYSLVMLTLVNWWCCLICCCYGCLEEERIGLLEIKAWINHPNGDSSALRGWVDNKEGADCCDWYCVECDNTTRRVIKLGLSYVRRYDEGLGHLYLNASVFLPFKELQSLDLSWNQLVGSYENQGFEDLISPLRKLEELVLSYNYFNDSSLSALGGLSYLKSLDLSNNLLTGGVTCVDGFKVLASTLPKLEELQLSDNEFNDSILSSLSGFSTLKSLDLSRNKLLTGSIGIKGLQVLEELVLIDNHFNDSILSSLSGLSSLKSLDLSANELLTGSTGIKGLRKLEALYLDYLYFNESILIQSLTALPSLKNLSTVGSSFNLTGTGQDTFINSTTIEYLDLSYTSLPVYFLQSSITPLPALKFLYMKGCPLYETLPTQDNFFHWTTLEELDLSDSSLPVGFLQGIGAMPSLRYLSLRNCSLNGTMHTQSWCESKKLQYLDLSQNNLEGLLPACWGNMSSLQVLDVSNNQFNGNIALSPLAHLTSLQYLGLSSNRFQVPVSFNSFMNHSNLKTVSCDDNELIVDPSSDQKIIPKFQLSSFTMSNCGSKELNTKIPNFLHSQYNLSFLDLSNNFFNGKFPYWLFENSSSLKHINLEDNLFEGPLQLPNHPRVALLVLYISNNNIHGQVDLSSICSIFPNLKVLRMSHIGLTGSISHCVGNMSYLTALDLSNNELFGGVQLAELTSLELAKLSNNNLDGLISPSVFNSSILKYLFLDGNNFVGQVPDISWINERLSMLDISNNHLRGKLPKWIGNMSNLVVLSLSKNQFEGPIPGDLCKLDHLRALDLSENKLSGSIPSCFNPPIISHVHLYKNQLSGPLTHAFYNSSSLVTLDLIYNNFTGPLPTWIMNLSSLSHLLLKANHFGGDFPVELCLLKKLSILDMSQNKFSGPLPSCLGNLTFKGNDEIVSSGISYRRWYPEIKIEQAVQFGTKRNYYTYKGDILNFMSGMDLSCNRFTGEIPPAIGYLSAIHAVNLSHNHLNGSIPSSFSNLKETESLDLSYNNLTGVIPTQLAELHSLAVFNVSYNNLSGKLPERKDQFGTFDESSYAGNPLLCGPPLKTSCGGTESPSQPVPNVEKEGDGGFIDMDVFYISFGVWYTTVVLTIVTILCINPYWRRRWFYFIEEFMDTCYCFVVVSYRKLSNCRRS